MMPNAGQRCFWISMAPFWVHVLIAWLPCKSCTAAVAIPCAAAQRVNKLVSVRPLASRYVAELGDVVVGRVTDVAGKRWRVDISAQQQSILQLSAVNLPGGIQASLLVDVDTGFRLSIKRLTSKHGDRPSCCCRVPTFSGGSQASDSLTGNISTRVVRDAIMDLAPSCRPFCSCQRSNCPAASSHVETKTLSCLQLVRGWQMQQVKA